MSAAELSCLFQPFSQATNSTTRKFGGTGLGLAISKRFAQMLGGDILVTSSLGKGSTFTVTLLAQIVHRIQFPSFPPECGQPAVPLPPDTRVLLAEDGLDNQRLITLILERAGANVVIAENGRSAVELIDNDGRFDLVLMDVQMPILDGLSATREIRAAGHQHQIVALTASALADDRERALRAGCNGYMTKPIDRAALVTLLHNSLVKATSRVE